MNKTCMTSPLGSRGGLPVGSEYCVRDQDDEIGNAGRPGNRLYKISQGEGLTAEQGFL